MRGGDTVRKVVKWCFRALYATAFAVLYYLLFSLFFDTPIEYELKKSTSRLSSRYVELGARFDSLQAVYDNISHRDKGVYKMIFESEPYSEYLENENRAGERETLERLSNIELSGRFDSTIKRFTQRVVAQNIRMKTQREYVAIFEERINHIPSIQPVDNKSLTLLTASYGRMIHPFYKTSHLHRGVDYSVPTGTAVFATADGVVERIENKGQSTGLSITLNHGANYKSLYANLDKVLVSPGSKVVRGDIIAFSGNSGLSFAPHLHYEVILDGKSINPLPFFFAELDMRRKAKMRAVASVGMQSLD